MPQDTELLECYGSTEGLPCGFKALFLEAKAASRLAAPLGSGFRVGCAGLFQFGDFPSSILSGFNLEKRLYNDGIHAEEAMFLAARVSFPELMRVMPRSLRAVATYADAQGVVSPCGSCRDWLEEYAADRAMPVLMSDGKKVVVRPFNVLHPNALEAISAGLIQRVGRVGGEIGFLMGKARDYFQGAPSWSADRPRFSAVRMASGEWMFGRTISQSSYHGVQSMEGLLISSRNEMPSDRVIESAYLIHADDSLELPFGCERQWLFGASKALGRSIPIYLLSQEKGIFRTDTYSIFSLGFSCLGL